MLSLTKENVKYRCRTCLSQSESMHSVDTLAKYLLTILNIWDCTDTTVTTQLPEILCSSCNSTLEILDKFYKRAKESTRILFSLFDVNCKDAVKIEDDLYKLLLKDTLMETESIILDSTASETLASIEIHDPIMPTVKIDNAFRKEWRKGETSERTLELIGEVSFDSESIDGVQPTLQRDITKQCRETAEVNNSPDVNNLPLRSVRVRSRPCYNNNKVRRNLGVEKRSRHPKNISIECQEVEMYENNPTSRSKRRNKGKNSFKCLQCNHCFAHKITLDAHIRKVHEGSKRPFQCDRCDKSYTFIGGLYTHIKEIHEAEVRSYSCDYPGCDRIYTSYIAMQKHKRTKHTEGLPEKKYVCEICGATFHQTSNLHLHRRNKHPTEAEQAEKEKCKERFECTICQKNFHSRYTLKYHTLQLHSKDIMRYECTICGRRMAKKFMLMQHMLVHSTEKMPCEHCGKQFIRKFELETHIRAVHMKLKPFECQYCSECFASRKTLRHHEYIHTGEKPYVCPICGQAYRQQTCLKNHQKTHDKASVDSLLPEAINTTLNSCLNS